MKKTLLLICLLGILTTTYTQGYQSIFGENKTTWHIFCHVPGYTNADPDPHLLGSGDTFQLTNLKEDTVIINGIRYSNVSMNDGLGSFAVREDTNKGQIFRYVTELQKEVLVCDMSLTIGDTFTFPIHSQYNMYDEQGQQTIVDSISYLNGKKIIYFSPLEYSFFYGFDPNVGDNTYSIRLVFIEGIGPAYGPVGYVMWWKLGLLLCVEKDDSLSYMRSPLLGCNQWGVSIAQNEPNPIKIYPNPASTELHLSLSEDKIVEGSILITDAVGRVMYQHTLKSSHDVIDISHYSSGIYVLQYITDNKRYSSKFIKSN